MRAQSSVLCTSSSLHTLQLELAIFTSHLALRRSTYNLPCLALPCISFHCIILYCGHPFQTPMVLTDQNSATHLPDSDNLRTAKLHALFHAFLLVRSILLELEKNTLGLTRRLTLCPPHFVHHTSIHQDTQRLYTTTLLVPRSLAQETCSVAFGTVDHS